MIVVVGGAGYIGSVCVELLLDEGYEVAVIDDLSRGHRGAVPDAVEFYQADMADASVIDEISTKYDVDAVMHFSALALVGESVEEPRRYWKQNVKKSIEMFEGWIEAGIDEFIFSSSAAVYGDPESLPITEDHPTQPINPYGRTKLACEWYLDDLCEGEGIRSVSLRYFNAAGAGKRVGEDHDPETHLIPNLLNAAHDGGTFSLYGTDYDTRDGTCLRDFVHVKDIARAHLLALKKIDSLRVERINLGTETGHTVREVVDAVKEITGRDINLVESEPRSGDPARLVASNKKARNLLGWEPERNLRKIIRDAWEWKQTNPEGYE